MAFIELISSYQWPGNIRQLKNFVEQISVIEENRSISKKRIEEHLPNNETTNKLVLYKNKNKDHSFNSEREILYKILFDMRKDINELKKLTGNLAKEKNITFSEFQNKDQPKFEETSLNKKEVIDIEQESEEKINLEETISQENLSLKDKEIELIQRALQKHKGKRKNAAKELQISERTLYRKIKQYNLQ